MSGEIYIDVVFGAKSSDGLYSPEGYWEWALGLKEKAGEDALRQLFVGALFFLPLFLWFPKEAFPGCRYPCTDSVPPE